jgi:hypothetical protein
VHSIAVSKVSPFTTFTSLWRLYTIRYLVPKSIETSFEQSRRRTLILFLLLARSSTAWVVRRLAAHSGAASLNRFDAWNANVSLDQQLALLHVAETAARAAGTILTRRLGCGTVVAAVKSGIKDVVTLHDTQAQHAARNIVARAYPQLEFLGEENVAPGAVASQLALTSALEKNEYVWIYDPIDGTANFATLVWYGILQFYACEKCF